MKKIKIILLAIAVVVSASLVYFVWSREKAKISRKNLILNPGFETLDESGRPKLWNEVTKGTWSVDSKETYQGKRSMRATVAWRWLIQDTPARGGKYYLLKAYVKSDAVSGEVNKNALVTLECLNKKGKVLKREDGVVGAPSFWKLNEYLILTPPKTVKIRIKLAKRLARGSIWFDNLALIESPSNLVLNPGFEMLKGLNWPESWFGSSRGGWSLENKGAYEGERCVQATVPWSWLWQDIPARPGKYYLLKSFVKSDIVVSKKSDYENALLTLDCLDRTHKVLKTSHGVVNGSSLWELRESAILAPPETAKIRIKLSKRQGHGSVWFDNLQLVELPSYLRIRILRGIVEDKPFFIFYFGVYFILIFSLVRIVLKS